MQLSLCKSFQNDIEIFEDKDYSKFVYCIVRENRISLNHEPEEFIRQCMLHYLVELSNLYPDLISIRVEFNDADIVIFPALPDDFQLYIPLAVIETKTNVNVNANKGQLLGYLEQFRCSKGFLFDGNRLIYFHRDEVQELNTLDEFKNIIDFAHQEVNYQERYKVFQNAQKGDIDALKELTTLFSYAHIEFEYLNSNGQLINQSGQFLQVTDQHLYFRVSGNYTKHKQKIELNNFKRVLGLRE